MMKATHIVGGEMNYTCLGNDQYEITLTIFRDCFNGDPNAWFDNPASIGVFNRENELLQEVLVPLMNNDTLNPILSGECFVVPPSVCVHTTTYRTTITLPPIIGGYQLAYQRCCRNQTIVNIVEPLATGATYGVTISEQALLECNSNPKFQEWPPLYICVDQPISFDQSAIDLDGDSIVYRLCTPLQGANQTIPQPQPPNPPPYQPITWIDPPYSVNNMLNGAPGGEPLQINSETGLLTGLPNTIGQFVVGICVEEYRDGRLISTTRRDFQYNVGICGQSVSSFFAPEIQCDDLTVEFDNTSEGANDYLWIFSNQNGVLGTTTEDNPVYTFPSTGDYEVMLIAEPGESCQDTFIQQLQLKTNTLVSDFNLGVDRCSDTLFLAVQDLSTDPEGPPLEWSWEVLPQGLEFQGREPKLFTTVDGEVTVRLTVTATNGCTSTIEKTIQSDAIQIPFLPDTLQICQGESIRIGSLQFPNYQFEWNPAESLDNASLSHPLASPDTTTLYTVQVSNTAECLYRDSVFVLVDKVEVIFPQDTMICASEILLKVQAGEPLQIEWSESPDFSDVVSEDSQLLAEPMGPTRYYMAVEDEAGCRLQDSVLIEGNSVDLEAVEAGVGCLGDTLSISFLNEDPSDELSIAWVSNPALIQTDELTALVGPIQGGESRFYVEVENQFRCMVLDSVTVRAIDTSEGANFFAINQCSDFNVQFLSESPNANLYQWDFGDPEKPGAVDFGATVAHEYTNVGTYEVTVVIGGNMACQDTFSQEIVIDEPKIDVDFSWELQTCADSTTIRFENLSSNTQSTFLDWVWTFPDTVVRGENIVDLTFTTASEIQTTLSIESSDGCRDSITLDIPVPVIDVMLSDSLQLCYGDSIGLNPNGNPQYMYRWTPSESLDDAMSFNPLAKPLSTTNYNVVVQTSDSLCSVARSVFVEVSDQIEYELPPDQLLCEEEFLLRANAEGELMVIWAFDPLFQNTIPEGDGVTVEPVGLQTYFVRLEDDLGCIVEDQLQLNGQAIRIEVLGDETICVGDTAQISVDVLGQDDLIFRWMPVDQIIGPSDEASILVSPEEDETFEVNIVNVAGCSLDTMVTIQLFNFVPPLDITTDKDTVREGETAQLMATENGGYIYQWQFDPTLDQLDIADPIASPVETTTYVLDIRDQNGCLNQAFITIVVFNPACLPPFVYVPNAFTPNGDGRNDVFKVFGDPIDEMELIIYDRWGEKVFESNQKDNGWDGSFRGKALSPDVYAYYVKVRCFNGQEYITKGNVTLIR